MSCVRYRARRGTSCWELDFRDQRGQRRILRQPKLTRDNDEDREKAQKLLLRYAIAVEDGSFQPKSEQHNFTYGVNSYLGALDVSKHTRTDYESIINGHLLPKFGRYKILAITLDDIEKYRSQAQAEGRAIATINKELTVLVMLFNHFERHGWAAKNPCKHVKKLKQPIDKRRAMMEGNAYNVQELQALFDAARTPFERVLFMFAATTGVRQSEQFALTWDDVSLDEATAQIRRSYRKRTMSPPKTAAGMRTIGLTSELVSQLKRWRLECPHKEVFNLVFPNSQGGYLLPHNLVRRHFYPAIKRAGLKRVRWHDLRHAQATLTLSRGVNLKDVQSNLGHASAAMTLDRYGHAIKGGESAVARSMDGLFTSAPIKTALSVVPK
jgi:integrase